MVSKLKYGVLGAGFFCALYLVWGSYFFERASIFSEGLETCFDRLRTGYVSALSGGKGSPDSSFFRNTEACFSEVVFTMEKSFYASLVKDLAPINNLVTDIHWFHKELASGEYGFSQRNQFVKLEDARRGIVDRLQSERKRQGRYMHWARNGFFVLAGMSLLFFLSGWLASRKKELSVPKRVSSDQLVKPNGMEKKWEKIFLAESLGGVLDSLVNRILVQGIRVELDVGEDSHIYAHAPSLKRVLEILFGHILDSFESEGHLGIVQKYGEDRMVLAVTPFVEKSFRGEDDLFGEKMIFAKLVRESGGRIDEISSGQIKISFMRVFQVRTDKPKGRLLKGKKKEVLRQLSSWQNE